MCVVVSISLFSCRIDKNIEVMGAPAYVQKEVVQVSVEEIKEPRLHNLEKIYNLIKSVSDDGEVHGSNTAGQYHKVYTMRDARANWAWGYKYKNVYLDVYPDVGRKSLGLGISYATQNKTQ